MMQDKVELPPSNENSKTAVWWDINSCPVPRDYDASLVGSKIVSALEKLGYSGPLTITAIGNLKRTSHRVLRAISSTGILVKHVPCGRLSISTDFLDWRCRNPPPATIMLISNSPGLDFFSRSLSSLQELGYNILLAYPNAPTEALALVTCAEWLWEGLLNAKGDNKQETTRQLLLQGESSCLFCTLCSFAGQSFENFISHLKGEEHALQMTKLKPRDLTSDEDVGMTNKVVEAAVDPERRQLGEKVLGKRKRRDRSPSPDRKNRRVGNRFSVLRRLGS